MIITTFIIVAAYILVMHAAGGKPDRRKQPAYDLGKILSITAIDACGGNLLCARLPQCFPENNSDVTERSRLAVNAI